VKMGKKPLDELLDHDYDGIREFDNDMPTWWIGLFYVTIFIAFFYFVHYHVLGTGKLSDAEYVSEIQPSSDKLQFAGEQSLLGLVLGKHGYHSPFDNPVEEMTPRQEYELQQYLQLSFKTLLMEAMSKAPEGELKKLEESFPDIYTAFLEGGYESIIGTGMPSSSTINNVFIEMTALTDVASLSVGKEIYVNNCVTCHGNQGQGGIGPNMTDDYWIHGGTFPDIAFTIFKGVPSKGMVAWGKALSTDEIKQVGSYISTMRGTNPTGAKDPQGELVTYEEGL
jgi:mono/diheme cytochrome c family protein